MSNKQLPSAILLFGVAGVGKTYLGATLSAPLSYYHYELDRDLTPAMLLALREGREFTEEIRDEFFQHAVNRIHDILSQYPRVIFTQGAYKERHRAFLRQHVPGLECVWVTAPEAIVQERLRGRGGAVTGDYAKLIHHNFEKPPSGRVFLNDTSVQEELIERLVGLF